MQRGVLRSSLACCSKRICSFNDITTNIIDISITLVGSGGGNKEQRSFTRRVAIAAFLEDVLSSLEIHNFLAVESFFVLYIPEI